MTQEEIDLIMEDAEDQMDKAIEHLKIELSKITTGKASPALVTSLMVSYYGTPTPMSQVANVSTSDSRTIVIQPWERSMLAPIEKSIFEANLGVTPMNDGQVVRLSIPPLTEERRRDLVKRCAHLGEESKVGVRSGRRDAIEAIKKAVKNGTPEDLGKKLEEDADNLSKKYIGQVDELVKGKEKEIMTI
ncbi:MAG TPA: ribosome recycling factor [Haliscomenobacter sp.]|uniref:ribosome recycling factor n=1 Tax=Haliscomenobacter sp. TaxID=2717303 RepID=UPI001DC63259|nr:ribosome recycling factor [Haliscomenobacter sp.]MBK9488093.1 ribosome recycling factor [Haliscomenobacter sp.]HOY15995.1 ribosome recycling factor [Haliscomenobacter sp.]HPH18375.1 ribosome recycling factor [Haliscomenobacter sp.]